MSDQTTRLEQQGEALGLGEAEAARPNAHEAARDTDGLSLCASEQTARNSEPRRPAVVIPPEPLPAQPRVPGEPTTAEIAAQALAYMRDSMAMPNALTDQEQNWIFGHLVTFASQLAAKVSRFEVIDHRLPAGVTGVDTGRVYIAKPCQIELSYQDGGTTLKVFVDGARVEAGEKGTR